MFGMVQRVLEKNPCLDSGCPQIQVGIHGCGYRLLKTLPVLLSEHRPTGPFQGHGRMVLKWHNGRKCSLSHGQTHIHARRYWQNDEEPGRYEVRFDEGFLNLPYMSDFLVECLT